ARQVLPKTSMATATYDRLRRWGQLVPEAAWRREASEGGLGTVQFSCCEILANPNGGLAMPRFHRLLAPIVAYILLVLPASAEKRVALVIGNSAYVHANALSNPVHDASDMAKALAEVGFDVILGLDLSKSAFDAKVRDFARALEKADVALF